MSEAPLFSVVVAIVSDTTGFCNTSHLENCLTSLTQQDNPPSMEIIVPVPPYLEGLEALRPRFPHVIFPLVKNLGVERGKKGTREHHDVLRAKGISQARGELVALIEDHGCPDRHWARGMVEKHQDVAAAVGGAIENGVDRLLNWAVYFCDFYRYQNPLPEGESAFLSDANVCYKSGALESVRPVFEDRFDEPSVNLALRAQGKVLAISPRAVVVQHRLNLRFAACLKERFIWGRSYGASRTRGLSSHRRITYAVLSPLLPALILPRMGLSVLAKRRLIGTFLKSLPPVIVLVWAWSLGESVGYLTKQS